MKNKNIKEYIFNPIKLGKGKFCEGSDFKSFKVTKIISEVSISLKMNFLSKVVNNDLQVTNSIYRFEDKNLKNNCLGFLMPSNRSRIFKESIMELKLHVKSIDKISFCKKGWNKYDLTSKCLKFIEEVIKESQLFLNVFEYAFIVRLVSIKLFGQDVKVFIFCLRISNKIFFKVIYSRFNLVFEYLFIDGGNNLNVLFPNQYFNLSFNSLEKFRNFSNRNPLSPKRFKTIIKRRLDIKGNLVLRGLHGQKIVKLGHMSRYFYKEGLKLVFICFYSYKGFVKKCYSKYFSSELSLSCFSYSFIYSEIPYTKVLSFTTNSRMSKYCKTFKNDKVVQNSSVQKTDKDWRRGAVNLTFLDEEDDILDEDL